MRIFTYICAIFIGFSSLTAQEDETIWAVFEINPNTTKLLVATYDYENQKVHAIHSEVVKLSFAAAITDKQFTTADQNTACLKLQKLKKAAVKHGAEHFYGFFTKEFQQLSNLMDFMSALGESDGVLIGFQSLKENKQKQIVALAPKPIPENEALLEGIAKYVCTTEDKLLYRDTQGREWASSNGIGIPTTLEVKIVTKEEKKPVYFWNREVHFSIAYKWIGLLLLIIILIPLHFSPRKLFKNQKTSSQSQKESANE